MTRIVPRTALIAITAFCTVAGFAGTALGQAAAPAAPAAPPAAPAPAPAPAIAVGANPANRQATTAVKDGWITMKIHSQFTGEDVLEGSNIDVDTTNGVAKLTGTVPTAAGKARAVAIAKATDGVKSVTDQLTLGPAEKAIDPGVVRETGRTTGRLLTDGYAKSAIYTKFIPEKALEDSDIDVDIKNGVVTLNGTVKSAAGRSRAVEIAKGTAGVKSVKDALTVK